MSSSKLVNGELVLIKINPGEDVITKIEDICILYGFKSASIIAAIGSLQQACYVYAKKDINNNCIIYSDSVYIDGPIELLNCQGICGEDLGEGTFTSHIHASFADRNNEVYGGHMLKDLNKVLVTVEITLLGYRESHIKKYYDNETGFNIFNLK